MQHGTALAHPPTLVPAPTTSRLPSRASTVSLPRPHRRVSRRPGVIVQRAICRFHSRRYRPDPSHDGDGPGAGQPPKTHFSAPSVLTHSRRSMIGPVMRRVFTCRWNPGSAALDLTFWIFPARKPCHVISAMRLKDPNLISLPMNSTCVSTDLFQSGPSVERIT